MRSFTRYNDAQNRDNRKCSKCNNSTADKRNNTLKPTAKRKLRSCQRKSKRNAQYAATTELYIAWYNSTKRLQHRAQGRTGGSVKLKTQQHQEHQQKHPYSTEQTPATRFRHVASWLVLPAEC